MGNRTEERALSGWACVCVYFALFLNQRRLWKMIEPKMATAARTVSLSLSPSLSVWQTAVAAHTHLTAAAATAV